MEINQTLNLVVNNIKTQNVIKALESLENQSDLNLDNMLVDAKVMDIVGDQISVKLADGSTVSGKLANNSNLNIGDISKFIIKSSNNNVTLDAVFPKETNIDNIIKNILIELDIKQTPENEQSLKLLIKNNMQLTKENINELSIGLKKFGLEDQDKALFMLKNKISFTDTNTETVNNYKDNKIKLSENIVRLTETLDKNSLDEIETFIQKEKQNLFQSEVKTALTKGDSFEPNKLLDILGKYKFDLNTCKDICSKLGLDNKYINFLDTLTRIPKKDLNNMNKIAKEFNLDFEVLKKVVDNDLKTKFVDKLKLVFEDKFDKETVKEFFDELNITSKILSEHPNKEVAKQAQEIKNNINFFSKFKEEMFFQIPVKINDKVNDTDIYYFKDKNKTKKSKSIETALVSINTANLGLFETFIKKNESAINIEFRLKDERTNKLVKENIEKLNELLQAVNYKLEGYTFKNIDEKFNLIKEQKISELQEVKISKFDLKT